MRAGVLATYLIIPILALYPLLPGRSDVDAGPYFAVLAAALAGVTVVHALPWPALFRRGWADAVRYAWSVLDIVLVTVAIELTGGPAGSPLFLVYALTTVFFAASYPVRGQVVLFVFTALAYLSTLPGSGAGADAAFLLLAVLAVLAFMASFLSRELMAGMAAHDAARAESDQRARLLAAVAGAGALMSVLDPERVLAAVVDAALRLGFQAADLCHLDDDGLTYTVVQARGLPRAYTEAVHPAGAGLVGQVLERRRTIVTENYGSLADSVEALRDARFRAVVAVPVWVQGRLTAVMEAGTVQERSIAAEEVEALELLASQAGRAIENARRFEEEREMVERLVHLDEMKNEFVSTVSHELRTPLTVVLGMATTIHGRWEDLDDDTRRQLMERILANAERLDEMVSSLLDFSRLQRAGTEAIHPTRFDVGHLGQSVAERLETLFTDPGLRVEVESQLPVTADVGLLERVFENLLANAAKHTPPGTAVVVRAHRDGGSVVVEVADTGPGIRQEDLARLGERFFRGGDPNTRGTRGLGLGLAIVREILDRHGSTLEVESVPGRGSVFRFRLPLAHAETGAHAETVAP